MEFRNDTYYKMVNLNSGLVADVRGKSKNNSVHLEQYNWIGEAFQQWIITETDAKGYYKITNQNSGLVMDVQAKSTSTSAPLEQYNWLNESFQKWEFEAIESIVLPSVQTQPLPNAPQYTSADENTLPDQTDPVITDYTLMPCIYGKR
ncbi:RICIN domain-containing protein [Bacillus mycoides]|uniref:RICIN domain-containing protein n=1 Tax=Bacillus mycoides TaxID=1405 RepID=UPI001F2DDE83|nr:RICIN domain-containing protein [Bacillus mycoides]